MTEWLPLLRDVHFALSRAGLVIALVMFAIGLYTGLMRHRDVTRQYRWATYSVTGLMLLEALIGLAMYIIGARPFEQVHLIYGMGAFLALPFFIFVEVTAKKRPAMGSYLWGFALLAGIIIRAIMTGAG